MITAGPAIRMPGPIVVKMPPPIIVPSPSAMRSLPVNARRRIFCFERARSLSTLVVANSRATNDISPQVRSERGSALCLPEQQNRERPRESESPRMLSRVKPLATILAEGADHTHGLKRSLGPGALTARGIGAIIGTGIFVLVGVGSATRAGPSLPLSFVIAGIVSALAALCYAAVSSKVPTSGSAFSYTYATVGEFLAWIVGWSLVLEYALGAATVSVGWSGYFNFILHTLLGWDIPAAWQHSHWDAVPGYANLPAAAIILLITALLVRGTRESGAVNAVIVGIKVLIVLFFIAVGIGHINPANYSLPAGPHTGLGGFFPFGVKGMLGGAAFMFFAYIGFDAVSTTAAEAKK